MLRRCFRATVYAHLEGSRPSKCVDSVVSEIKIDLESRGVQEIVAQLKELRASPEAMVLYNRNHESLMFALLLHQVCSLFIVLLNAETVIQGCASPEALPLATSVVHLIDEKWFDPVDCNLPHYVSSYMDRGCVMGKVLWISGLVMNPATDLEGNANNS